MKRQLVLLVLVAGLAGCPRDEPAPPSNAAVPPAAAARPVATVPFVRSRSAFASLPDRGDLIRYSRVQPQRRAGAYTWHRAQLSEAHALRAIADGGLHLQAPSGRPLAFEYERHVEHPGGDWTWIGRLRGGQASDRVILTFGADAVFGSIAQPGQPALRLTTRGGKAWVVETDAAALAQVAAASADLRPDYRVPPEAAAGRPQRMAGAPVAGAAARVTVDLLIGYTAGFAASLGGQSQALTRLNYLVDVNNQAYLDSQLDAQVRLVHAMQVSYADATANDAALTGLTGHTGSETAPVAPELQPLRQARETYNADLVSLVRKYEHAENEGCGVAWLIGGGRTAINQSSEFFGYSVVGDGVDAGDDGNNYFCLDETLAHEMGHNLGSQHDRATATDGDEVSYGAFAYSFGYKVGALGGNFSTIMAYGDPGQTRYSIFSNPRTTFCGGRPCGIAEQADNARSKAQTLPIIASFRGGAAPVSRARRDIDGDGKSEVLFHSAGGHRFAWWRMNGASVVSGHSMPAGAGYAPVGAGDFNNDGRSDNIWFHAASRLVLVQLGTGNGFTNVYQEQLSAGWVPVGAADVTGDGNSDLLFFNPGTRQLLYRVMIGGTVVQSRVAGGVGAGYVVAGVGDINADGKDDILWTSAARDMYLWASDGMGFTSRRVGTYGAGYAIVGMADIDGDGRDDILFHSPAARILHYKLMQGFAVRSSRSIGGVGAGYTVGALGDYNGDGKADIAWHNANDRRVYTWIGSGTTFTSTFAGIYAAGYVPSPPPNR